MRKYSKVEVRIVKSEFEQHEQELSEAAEALASARHDYEVAAYYYEFWARLYYEVAGKGNPPPTVSTAEIMRFPTIAALSRVVLSERGPMTSRDLATELRKRGKPRTTGNSVNTTLSRRRPEDFDKNEKGEWFAVEQTAETK